MGSSVRFDARMHHCGELLADLAVLIQKDDDGKECVIAYASQSNNDAKASLHLMRENIS